MIDETYEMATVWNVHLEPMQDDDIYIGRCNHRVKGGGAFPAGWGNPFHLRAGEPRGATIERFRRLLWQAIEDDARRTGALLTRLADLHGKRLFCHCAPEPCHGDVLARAAAWAAEQLRGQST